MTRLVSERKRIVARYLVETQTDDGWPYDMVYGVFNRNCMINYDNYRYYFPLWALARYRRVLGELPDAAT